MFREGVVDRGLREYWVCDVVVGVVGEGDGDGVAGILEDFFYSV